MQIKLNMYCVQKSASDEKTPLTFVRGEKLFPRYHPDLPPQGDISCHPVTWMNRSAPRGLLQSGCFAAWVEGLHRPLSLKTGFTKLTFSLHFFVHYTGFQEFVNPCMKKSHVSSSEGKSLSSASSAAAGAPICISCHWARVINSWRGLDPSKGPTIPRSSI